MGINQIIEDENRRKSTPWRLELRKELGVLWPLTWGMAELDMMFENISGFNNTSDETGDYNEINNPHIYGYYRTEIEDRDPKLYFSNMSMTLDEIATSGEIENLTYQYQTPKAEQERQARAVVGLDESTYSQIKGDL